MLINELRRTNTWPQQQLQIGLRVYGILEPEVLRRSIAGVIAGNEVLRTVFRPSVQAGPICLKGWGVVQSALKARRVRVEDVDFEQAIRGNVQFKMPTVAIRMASPAQHGIKVSSIIRVMAATPFDFSGAPHLRAILAQWGSEEQTLITTMPHLVADGWSLKLYLREIVSLYDMLKGHGMVKQYERQTQYIDFARDQARRFDAYATGGGRGRRLMRCAPLKASQLRGALMKSGISGGMSRQHGKAGFESVILRRGIWKRVCHASREHRATVAMLFLASLATLLQLQCRVSKCGIWVAQANRTSPAFEGVFGFLASGQMICADIRTGSTFSSVVAMVKREVSEAIARRDIADCQPNHEHFALEVRNAAETLRIGGLRADRINMGLSEIAEFGIRIVIDAGEEEAVLGVVYCTACYSKAMAQWVGKAVADVADRACGNGRLIV